ncbi:MAG: glycosyltransferase family 1 protein [Flavobacteriales bacterium]
MRIAVNTRLLLPDKLEGIGWFTHETMRRITQANPQHQFIYLFDRPWDKRFIHAPNVTPVAMGPPTRHPLLYRLWFDWLLPRKLRAVGAEAFISPDGYLSLRSNVPTLAVMHDLNFEHYPEDLPRAYRNFYRGQFPRYAHHATRLATVSEFSRRDISVRYGIDQSRIDVVYNGVSPAYAPLSVLESQQAVQRFGKGAPYFICVGSLHPRKNIARLLQAFDHLLVHHPSEVRLLVVGESFWWDERMKAAWAGMRYKDRVEFTGRLDQRDLRLALGGALALAFVSYFEGFGIPIAEAMRCGVPVLAAETTALPEVAGDAALYCDPFSVASIAEGLYTLQSDPELRDRLSAQGLKRSQRYTWENAASDLWASFQRMCSDAGLERP